MSGTSPAADVTAALAALGAGPGALAIADLRRLDEEGWLLLPGVATPGEVAALRKAWEARRVADAPGMPRGANSGPPGLLEEPAGALMVLAARPLAAVAHLLDGDVALWSVEGRDPPAGHGRQGLHADWNGPVPAGTHLIVNSFWVLDDMDAGNGATRLVPGTHLIGRVPRGAIAQPGATHRDEVVVRAAAGDVVIVSSHVWHSGTENRDGRRRRVVNVHFARRSAIRGSGLPRPGEATLQRLGPHGRAIVLGGVTSPA